MSTSIHDMIQMVNIEASGETIQRLLAICNKLDQRIDKVAQDIEDIEPTGDRDLEPRIEQLERKVAVLTGEAETYIGRILTDLVRLHDELKKLRTKKV